MPAQLRSDDSGSAPPCRASQLRAAAPRYADVKLIVLDGSKAGGYRQAVPVGFDPAAAGAPTAPNTDSCGSLTTQEQADAVGTARRAAATVAPGQTVRKEDLTG